MEVKLRDLPLIWINTLVHVAIYCPGQTTDEAIFLGYNPPEGIRVKVNGVVHNLPWEEISELWPATQISEQWEEAKRKQLVLN